MTRGDAARELVVEMLPEGRCLSLPIPVNWRGQTVDAFFCFSISYVGMVPYPADKCFLVLPDGEVKDGGDIFDLSSVKYDTSSDVAPTNWAVAYETAYQSYDAAFEELSACKKGPACMVYVEAVREATPASQLPYYSLLCPELFG